MAQTKNDGLQNDPVCVALMEKAERIGKADLKRGKFNWKNIPERDVGFKASSFKLDVYRSILSGIEK